MTTLNPNFSCDHCGQPAMVKEDSRLSCPECWLERQSKRSHIYSNNQRGLENAYKRRTVTAHGNQRRLP